jgi:phospholipid/cholesterol/gamma-HCH transport system ATP-binding protein
MIEIKDIRKEFGGKEVLKGVSGTFEAGRCNLIIGSSGTGKSVLLKNIVGLMSPDSGSVLYDKRDFWAADTNIQKDIRRELGMLFQGSALFDSMTVEQNVMFPLHMLSQMSKEEKKERVKYCLQRVGLEGAENKKPSEISGGMQKRVGIARAIVLSPKYLFVDEPNSGLDPQTAVKIDELIMEITKEYNTTTVIVTHDMNSVMGIGEYIMYMYKGLKLWEGNNNEILHSDVKELNEFIFSSSLMRKLKH